MSFLEPSPVFLAFIFVQRFVFFELLAVLALLRCVVGRGLARLPALIVLAISCAVTFVAFAPALNLQSLPVSATITRLMALGGGLALPLATSAIFAVSLLIPSRRWRWIDIGHGIIVTAFLGLWLVTRL